MKYNESPFSCEGIKKVAEILGLSVTCIIPILNNPRRFFYIKKIKSQSGKERNLYCPSKSFAQVQKMILKRILEVVVLPPSMHGYVKKHSTLTNARCHVGKKYVAKFDISRFFPSVHYERVRKIFISLGHAQEESAILTRLVTIDYCLPHGYTTSPRLSCITLINLDRRISHILQFGKRGVHTFYSDDITVSSNSDISDLKELIIRAIELEGFSAKRSKCVLKGKGERKEVTGYIVNESKISLPRVRRNKLKAILYNCIVFGPLSQIPEFEKVYGPLKLKTSSRLEKFKEVLRGKVVYIKASNEISFRKLKRMFDLILWRSTV